MSSAAPDATGAAGELNTANTASRAHLPVTEAYARWAAVYDTDNNPLQATDSVAMRALLPLFLDGIAQAFPALQAHAQAPFLVDLGCGTGRNTLPLLTLALSDDPPPLLAPGLRLLALDVTPAMLAVAEQRCTALLDAAPAARRARVAVEFRVFDLLKDGPADLDLPRPPDTDAPAAAHGVLSSLVAEHVPLAAFFGACSALLQPHALLLATNMHPDMGRRSGAGFTDAQTGEKVRVHGFVHEVADFATGAAAAGFQLLVGAKDEAADETHPPHRVREISITSSMLDAEPSLGPRGSKWLGVAIWMGAIWRKTGAGTK